MPCDHRTPFSASLALLAALVVMAAPVAADEADAPAAASNAAKGPIEKLVAERKFQDAILQVEALRNASPTKVADPDSEFWAAKAELGMNLQEAARDRFLLIGKTYPKHQLAGTAAVEAVITKLRGLGDGKKLTPEQKAGCAAAAKELEVAGTKYADDPESAPRAFYIAGNAWKMSGDLGKARANWERARTRYTKGDYPAKATTVLAAHAAQDFDVAHAKELLSDCVSKLQEGIYPEGEATKKCVKNLTRISVVGTPAPAFVAETWLNSPPVTIESLRGNVVLVFFFATWCPHCKAAMPEIGALLKEFAGKPIKAIGITYNSKGQTTEGAKTFVEDPANHLTWPAAVDLEGRTSAAYEGSNVPTLVLVDKKGIIRWIDHPVYMDRAMVEKLLAE